MASKQVAKVVDWSQILQRTTAQTRPRILAFKNKTDGVLAENVKAKTQDATINWEYYQTTVNDKALVADFKKKFDEFKVPQPADTKSSQLLEKAREDKVAVDKFLAEQEAKINSLRVNLDRLLALPACDQLTTDDVREHFPQTRPDYKKHPYWPHQSMEYLSKTYDV